VARRHHRFRDRLGEADDPALPGQRQRRRDFGRADQVQRAALVGVRVLVLNALLRHPHPTHLSIAEAVAVAQEIGAERTFFTHLTHDTAHADLAAELPVGIEPAYDGLVVRIP
jgi:phosphoribosyl 1,2-cyclic phosphate phosphodiesterase